MMRPVIRLINVNVNRSHSLGYPRRAFQWESLFDQLRAMWRDSVVFEWEVHEHLWFKKKIYHSDFYLLVSTNQRHKKLGIDYSREQGIHDYS